MYLIKFFKLSSSYLWRNRNSIWKGIILAQQILIELLLCSDTVLNPGNTSMNRQDKLYTLGAFREVGGKPRQNRELRGHLTLLYEKTDAFVQT